MSAQPQSQIEAQRPSATPPGWYPDPMGGGGERYWDGIAWSEHFTRPAQPVGAVGMPAAQPFTAGQVHTPQGAYQQAPMSTVNGGQYVVVPNDTRRSPSECNGLVIAGWVCAILIPIIGLIIGAVLQSRQDDRGKAIMLVAVAVIVINVLIMQSLGSDYSSSR